VGKAICVYCSSSDAVGEPYRAAASDLGTLVGARGHSLVFGGGRVGLMGIVCASAREAGARVTGIIPEALASRGVASSGLDRLIVTRDMRDRKAAMVERSDAFIALPGGFGTLEELLETMTLRQLGYHDKAVALVNTEGFYDGLLAQLERLYELRFSKPEFRALYAVCASPADAVAYVESFVPAPLPAKWTGA
jgi:cytokinin riboside 5'-monophosphate phosphoribohydrolase